MIILISQGLKVLLGRTAERAGPLLGKILKIRAGLNSVFNITLVRLILVTTKLANVYHILLLSKNCMFTIII